MAIMARDITEVDILLKLNPSRQHLFHSAQPMKDAFNGKTDEEQQRKQRNEKRRVDWENECKFIKQNGQWLDPIPWDEAHL